MVHLECDKIVKIKIGRIFLTFLFRVYNKIVKKVIDVTMLLQSIRTELEIRN